MAMSDQKGWVVRASPRSLRSLPADLWAYRDMIMFVLPHAIFDVHGKKVLGVLWLLVRPAAYVIGALFLAKALNIQTGNVPPVIFMLASLTLWTVFGRGVFHGTKAISRSAKLLRRANFPRTIVLLASLPPALMEASVLVVGTVIAIGIAAYHGTHVLALDWRLALLIPILLQVMLLSLATSSVTSVLNSLIPDVALTQGYLIALLMVITPVFFPLQTISEDIRIIVAINPLVAPMEWWRWALFDSPAPGLWITTMSIFLTFCFLIGGLIFFLHFERMTIDLRV